jgi:hypothetical protein
MLKLSRIRPCEYIKKVVVFSTTNPTKLVWHFSEISTIFYAFYKLQQKGYTIEDITLRLGPWKDSGSCNWVPRPTGRRARRNSDGAPGRGTARGQVHVHLGWVDGLGSGEGVVGVGVRRWPATVAAAAQGSCEEKRTDDNMRLWEVLRVLGERVGQSASGESEWSCKLTSGGDNGGRRLGWRTEGKRAAFK